MKDKTLEIYVKNYFMRHSFKAKLVVDVGGFKVIDWRAVDTGNMAMRFIVDLSRGYIGITGDAGDASYCWYNRTTIKELACYMKDIPYSFEKIRSGDKYEYDLDVAEDDIKEIKDSIDFAEVEDDDKEILDTLWNTSCLVWRSPRLPPQVPEYVLDVLDKYYEIFESSIYMLGQTIAPQVYWHHYGFFQAVQDLKKSGAIYD